MAASKLKKGDRIYECRYREATLTELITDPELVVQGGDSHYWHWQARVVETQSRDVAIGDVVEYGITEEAPAYGPKLFRKNVYEVGYDDAEPVLPPFDCGKEEKCLVQKLSIKEDVEILGHVFHGLQDIKDHVEMSQYIGNSRDTANSCEPKSRCEVHVGELWASYPCFDSEDFMYEDRTYQNYIFRSRPITQDDMGQLSALSSRGNYCRLSENVPSEMLPMVYYVGDGDTMIVGL